MSEMHQMDKNVLKQLKDKLDPLKLLDKYIVKVLSKSEA